MNLIQATGLTLIVLAAAAHPAPSASGTSAARAPAALKSSARELARLADGVERGAIHDAKTLDQAFAKAKRALQQSAGAAGHA